MRKTLSAACLLFGLWVAPLGIAAVQIPTRVTSTVLGIDRVDMNFENGEAFQVQLLTPEILRMRFAFSGTYSSLGTGATIPTQWHPVGASVYSTDTSVFLVGPQAQVIITKSPFSLTVLRADLSIVLQTASGAFAYDAGTALSRIALVAVPGEHFLGLGERPGPLDRRGRKFVLFNVDAAGFDEFTDPLYISVPFYYGFRNGKSYGVFLDNAAQPVFDFDSGGSGTVVTGVQSGDLDLYVLTGPTPLEVSSQYASLTGNTPLPPKWSLGFHMSRYGYKTQDEILQVARTFRNLGIPADGLWFDIDYMDHRHQFTWDPVGFPSPAVMQTELESEGFERVNIIEPCLLTDDPVLLALRSPSFFLSDQNRQTLVNSIFLGNVQWLDFTSSPLRTWYKQQLENFLGQGISAIWNDLNEPAQNYMPQAIYDFDGQRRTDLQARDLYALNVTQLSYQALRELRPNERPWVISRSGFAGIQRYAANWGGDSNSTFDALSFNIEETLSMGISGQNFFGHDIGGFLGDPSPELMIRWEQFSLFTPLFRNHSSNTTAPREPWLLPDGFRQLSYALIRRRYQMLPYLYSLMELAARTGQPVVVPPAFWFPTDPGAFQMNKEFMLGSQLLVAPVYVEGAITRTLYLPAGSDWINVNDDVLYPGGQTVTVDAPINIIPVFVRAGSIIPGASVTQNTRQQPSEMILDVYPGADASFTVYEDDGRTFDYQNADYLRTAVNYTQNNGLTELTIRRDSGGWVPSARNWQITIHRWPSAPVEVRLNNFVLERRPGSPRPQLRTPKPSRGSWYFNELNQTIVITVPDMPDAMDLKVEPRS